MKKKETTLPPTNLYRHLSAENRHYGFDSAMADNYTAFFEMPEMFDFPIILNNFTNQPIDIPPSLTQFLSKMQKDRADREFTIHNVSQQRMTEIKTILDIVSCGNANITERKDYGKEITELSWDNYTKVYRAFSDYIYADMNYRMVITRISKNRYDITIKSRLRTQCEKIRSKLQQ